MGQQSVERRSLEHHRIGDWEHGFSFHKSADLHYIHLNGTPVERAK